MTTVNIPLESYTYGNNTVAIADITPAGLAYLITNGFNQALNDVISGVALKAEAAHRCNHGEIVPALGELFSATKTKLPQEKAQEYFTSACDDMGENLDLMVELSAGEFAKRYCTFLQTDKFTQIVNGTVRTGTTGPRGPRLSPIDAEIRTIAEEDILAKARSVGKKAPKGPALAALRDEYIAKAHEILTTRAKRRLEEREALAGIDIPG